MGISERLLVALCLMIGAAGVGSAAPATAISPVPLAQCCGLDLLFEIQRYPRYPRHPVAERPWLNVVVNGRRDLVLPGLGEGGYRLTFEPIALTAGKSYRFIGELESKGKLGVTAEIFAGTRRVVRVFKSIERKGDIELAFEANDVPKTRDARAVHVLRLWLRGNKEAVLKRLHLEDEEGAAIVSGDRSMLLPDRALGVYDTGQGGEMRLLPAAGQTVLDYRIDQLLPENKVLRSVSFTRSGAEDVWRIPIETHSDGYFRVQVRLMARNGGTIQVSRHYVVLGPARLPLGQRRFYGMCTEEEGLTDLVPAAVSADELYELLERMGVGSVRMFNPAMPGELSRDGIRYDFHALDSAISTAQRHGMEILLELGSNRLSRLPAWLLTSTPAEDTIDLRRGMRFAHQKRAFRAKGYDRTPYLDLKRYRAYLVHVFSHLRGQVRNYEIWNEPGHKFRPEDFIRIVRITREVQKKYAPGSYLVGFSSTAYPGFGKGRDRSAVPGFLGDMLHLGGGELVDVISYHSRHAFNFLGRKDQTDPRTDYALRIRKVLAEHGYEQLPLWDTERAVPWSTRHGGIDRYGSDKSPYSWLRPFGAAVPAKQMEVILAQAKAQLVDRLFWFNYVPGTEDIGRKRVRESVFDVGLEPTGAIWQYATWMTDNNDSHLSITE